MKKRISLLHKTFYTKKERRIIMLGYLRCMCGWGIVILVSAIAFGICNLFGVNGSTEARIMYISAGMVIIGLGIYDIIGAILGFKHILVASQLIGRNLFWRDPDPRRAWRKKDKIEYIVLGTIEIIAGVAIIAVPFLASPDNFI